MSSEPSTRFRLTAVEKDFPASRIPLSIARLGKKPTQYAQALMRLAAAGNREAALAFAALDDAAQRAHGLTERNALKALEMEGVAPLDLFPTARCFLDAGGLVALELLLWLWRARATPLAYGSPYGDVASEMEPFDEDSADRWWEVACSVSDD